MTRLARPLFLACFALLALLAARGTRGSRAWIDSLDPGLDRALGGALLVLVRDPALALGRELEERVSSDARVQELLGATPRVRLDPARQPLEVERALGARAGLALALLDGQGRRFALRAGALEPDELCAFLARALADRGAIAELRARVATARASLAPSKGSDDPTRARARVALARLLERNGCADLAIEHCRAAAGDAADATGAALLARLFALDGDLVAAREALERARQLARGDPTGELALAEGALRLAERRPSEAARALELALSREPHGDTRDAVLTLLGDALHWSGDARRALPLLAEVASADPPSRWAARARRHLREILEPPPEHRH